MRGCQKGRVGWGWVEGRESLLRLQLTPSLRSHHHRFGRTKSGRRDTSQKGNWENFRNETMNGRQVLLNSNWFLKIPRYGKVRFDYVSTTRPGKAAKQMSQRRYSSFLERLKLEELDAIRRWYDEWTMLEHMNEEEERLRKEKADAKLAKKSAKQLEKEKLVRGHAVANVDTPTALQPLQRKTIASVKSTPLVDAIVRESRKNFVAADVDHAEIMSHRAKSRRRAIDATTEIPVAARRMMGKAGGSPSKNKQQGFQKTIQEEDDEDDDEDDDFFDSGSGNDLKFKKPFKVPEFIDWIEANAHWKDYMESSHQAFNYYGLEAAKDMSKQMAEQKLLADRLAKEELAKKKPLKAYLHLYCKLQELEVAACSVFMTVKQAMHIVEKFPRQEYARVQAVVALHKTLIDLENFHHMFKLLDENDSREIFHR